MSLILDALKQADRDRRVGQPPDVTEILHMKSGPAPRHRIWLWLCMAVLAIGVFFVLMHRPVPPVLNIIGKSAEHPAGVTPQESVIKADRVDPAPAPEVAKVREAPPQRFDSPVPPSPSPNTGDRITRNPQPSSRAIIPAAPAAAPEIPPAAPPAVRTPARDLAPSETGEGLPEEQKKPEVATEEAQPDTRSEDLPFVGQLPPEIREPLQGLEISAHVYNPDPTRRFVFINQHSYHEGDTIGDNGPILKEILPDGIVIDYGKGQARLLVKRPRLW